MKAVKKLSLFLPILAFVLGGCNHEINTQPTDMSVATSPVKMIIHSVRDLNDIVTLRFTPKNTTNRNVTWSCEKNDVISLVDSTITANKVGTATVTATSVENHNLSCNVNIEVYDPNVHSYIVSFENSLDYALTGLKESYLENETVTFAIELLNDAKEIEQVKANEQVLTATGNNEYSFTMPNQNVKIVIQLKDKELNPLKPAEKVKLSTDTLNLVVGKADGRLVAQVTPTDTTDVPSWKILTGNDVVSITPTNNEVTVHALKKGTASIQVTYNENVSTKCLINVIEEETPSTDKVLAKYNISYDLAGRKTAKAISSTDELKTTLQLEGEEDIITSIDAMEAIYGGGNGGRGETAWYANDLLKVGTTSMNGSVSLSLSTEVNRIRITGYVSDNACKLRVGNSESTDWIEDADDNQTTLVTCSNMNESTKDIVGSGLTSMITIDFTSTKNFKLSVTNKKTLYIASIEFIVSSNEQK